MVFRWWINIGPNITGLFIPLSQMPVFQHWVLVGCHGNMKTAQIGGGVHTQHYMLFRISAKLLKVFKCPVKRKYNHWFRSVADNSNKPWLGITLGTLTLLTHYHDWKQGIRTLRNATCLTRREQSPSTISWLLSVSWELSNTWNTSAHFTDCLLGSTCWLHGVSATCLAVFVHKQTETSNCHVGVAL